MPRSDGSGSGGPRASGSLKAILEIKGLPYVTAPLEVADANAEIAAWSGQNSAPVVAWQEEKPLNRWLDILLLAERLALLPADPRQRALAVGLCHEMMGERGIGWNRRQQMFAAAAVDAVATGARVAATLGMLAAERQSLHARGAPQPGATVLTVVEA